MSAKATFWAWEQPIKHAPTKLVLLRLADRAGDHDSSWPSMAGICEDTGLSESEVRRCLKSLEASGLIKTIRRQREDGSSTSNYYKLDVKASVSAPTPSSLTPPLPSEQTPQESTSNESDQRVAAGAAKLSKDQRNELLQALALTSPGCKLDEVTPMTWGSIAKCLKEILSVTPDLTAAEISRRTEIFKIRYDWKQPSPRNIASHWAEIGVQPELTPQQKKAAIAPLAEKVRNSPAFPGGPRWHDQATLEQRQTYQAACMAIRKLDPSFNFDSLRR